MADMLINGTDIAVYNAKLLNYQVSGTTITNNISSAGVQLRTPALYNTIKSTRTLTITLTFKPHGIGANSENTLIKHRYKRATENIARFEALIVGKKVEISLPDGYIYNSLVTTISAAEFDASGEHDVTYTFLAIRHLPVEQIKVKSNQNVYCKSTTDTPFRLIFTTRSNLANITVCGVTIKSVPAETEIVIDSENGLVTANGNNKFLDTNLTDFPILKPGENKIDCIIPDIDFKVVYTPIFV